MKVTNISASTLYLADLVNVHEGQHGGTRGEDRYLAPNASVYLPNTSEVLRSIRPGGNLYVWRQNGVVDLEDQVDLAANGNPGDSVTLTHNFGTPPAVVAFKQVGITWVDATGTYDAVHNETFTTVTFTNTVGAPLTFFIRLM